VDLRLRERTPQPSVSDNRAAPQAHGAADRAEAWHQAVVAIGRIVRQQAYIMAFSDTFFLLGAGLIVALVAALLLKKPDHVEADGAH
jgi:MFS transporter, DHA2 family, multidrug resistance protein